MGTKPCTKLVPSISTKKLLINRGGSCPYHKCLTGRGVCFMATRAPPQSRNQTLYSSSKIWNNNNNNNSHSNALHCRVLDSLQSLSRISFHLDYEPSNNPTREFGTYCHPHLIDEEMDLQNSLPRPLKCHCQGSFP